MKKITSLITIFLFLLCFSKVHAFKKESFVTVTIPVRGQENWTLIDQQPLDLPLFYYEQASQSGIPTSYMLRYDAVEDQEISSSLGNLVATDSAQLLGGLLEVTPKLAKKANVNYQNHGSFNTANRLFLSGYTREDRLRIIDIYMESFFSKFGNYPPVVGVDSLDSYSFNYLVSHYSVIATFVEDETYQAGNLRQWGGVLAEPYLPSKTNILFPAQNVKNKINGVVFKWSPADSLHILSKNPPQRSIFAKLPSILENYTQKTLNESTHLNIRLDNNYQLTYHTPDKLQKTKIAKNAIVNLIAQLKNNQEKHTLNFKSTAEMGELIKARYPETSPASFFILGDIYWYQNPHYRLVLKKVNNKTEIIDFRVYDPKITGEYYHQKNIQATAFQETQSITSSAILDLSIDKAKITSEYWDLIITDGQKVLRAEPQKIIFKNFTPPNLETNQVKIKASKNSTQWLINPTLPFQNLANSNYFVLKLATIFLIIFLIFWLVQNRKYSKTLFLGLVLGFLSLIPVVFSGQVYSFGLGLWGPNGHDAVFHLSVINSLKDSLLSLAHPQLSGFFLQNYHLGVDWLVALTSKLTGLEAANLFFFWLPVVLVAMIVFQLIKLLTSWKFSKPAIYLSLFMAFLAGSFGFIFTLVKFGNPFAGESLFWMNQSVSIFLNPPFAFSIALLLTFLNLYSAKGSSEPQALRNVVKEGSELSAACSTSTRRFATLILIGGLLAQVKIYAFILLLLSLLIIKEFKLFIFIALVGFILSLPTLGLQGSPFIFSPLWFPKSLVAAQDKLDWQKLAQAWQVYEVNAVYLKLFIVNSLALMIYLLGNLGTRVIGLLNILKKPTTKGSSIKDRSPASVRMHSPGVRSVVLVKLIIILGLIIPLLFIQTNNPWNTIQFSYYSLFFLGLFTAKEFTLKKRSVITWVLFVGLTLPTTIGTLKDYITPYSASKISFTELQALEILKNQEKGVVISPIFSKSKASSFPEPKPLYAYTSTAYISAFSGQPEYLSDLINLSITGLDYKERAKNTQRLYRTVNADWVKDFLLQENIKYVYTTPISDLQIKPQNACLSPIFDSGEIIIYKINCHE